MEKWLPAIILVLCANHALSLENNCSTELSILGGDHIICINVTPSYFQFSGLKLNRSHWLTCIHCNLNVIKENTFNFGKNNISYLNFTENNILTIEGFALSKFSLTKYLNLRRNIIEAIDPKAFTGLKRLLHLDLSKNRLKIVRSNSFAELESLDILNLNDNNITYLNNDAFVGLMNLKYLYLNNNKIKTLLADSFKYLTNLKILYLENNRIRDIHPVAFNNLRNLNYLYLNNNSISYLVQYNFKQLSSLVDLQLRYNNLSEIQTSSFNGLNSLKFLYLGENKLSTVQPYGFIGLNSLLILDLIGNKFEYFALDYFKNMISMTTLWLEKNKINNFTVSKDSDLLPSLRVLDMVDNNLNFFNYKLLHNKMPSLDELIIGKSGWNCEFLLHMYDFFQQKNVSVCLNNKCNATETELYVQESCRKLIVYKESERENEEDIAADFAVDSSEQIKQNIFVLIGIASVLISTQLR